MGLIDFINNKRTKITKGDYVYTKETDSSGLTGWKVDVLDKTKTEYGPIESKIGGIPVTDMHGTFKGCENLVIAPEIPATVEILSFAFADCPNLKTYVGSKDADGDFSNFIPYVGFRDFFEPGGPFVYYLNVKDVSNIFDNSELIRTITGLEYTHGKPEYSIPEFVEVGNIVDKDKRINNSNMANKIINGDVLPTEFSKDGERVLCAINPFNDTVFFENGDVNLPLLHKANKDDIIIFHGGKEITICSPKEFAQLYSPTNKDSIACMQELLGFYKYYFKDLKEPLLAEEILKNATSKCQSTQNLGYNDTLNKIADKVLSDNETLSVPSGINENNSHDEHNI